MALRTIDLGPVSSYAIAVSKGYTGTEDEWYELLHSITENAASAKHDAQAAAESAEIAGSAAAAAAAAGPAAIAEIQQETATQKAAIQAEGQDQVGNVQSVGTSAVESVQAQQGTSEQAVYNKGTEQETRVQNAGTTAIGNVDTAKENAIAAVQSEGTTQAGLVTAEGAEQVEAVEEKGAETLASIPADYTALSQLLVPDIPGTTQKPTFADGQLRKIEHISGNAAVRTDTFTFSASQIVEVRELSSGETVTLTTDLSTLQTTVSAVTEP